MNTVTYSKIVLAADRLWKIHQNPDEYKFVIPLLDEPYQLALLVMEHPDLSDYEVAKVISVNWQTVRQIRKALNS